MQSLARKPAVFLRKPAVLLASAFLAAAVLAVPRAHASCGEQHDFLVRSDPLLAAVRPADCATLLGEPPQFTWPQQEGRNRYTVALRFPDGHTETRSTDRNWLAWDRAVPSGEYSWRVSVAGRAKSKSEARAFRVERADRANPRAPSRVASSASTPSTQGAAVADSASSLFRLEPAESWIPSAQAPRTTRRPAVGGFFGGFTQ